MKHIKILLLSIVGSAILGGIMAASALAAPPTILFEAGKGTPVTISSEKESNVIKSELQNSGGKLIGEGLSLSINVTNLQNTGDTS